MLLGLVAGAVCALAVGLKYRLGFDDSLDVVGVHFVGGWIGSLWIGLFATTSATAIDVVGASDGLFYGGGARPARPAGAGARCRDASTRSASRWVLGCVIDKTIGFRVSAEAEVDGIDVAEHAESAYDLSPPRGSGAAARSPWPGSAATARAGRRTTADEADESGRSAEKVAG